MASLPKQVTVNPIHIEQENTGKLVPTPGGRGRTLGDSEWMSQRELEKQKSLNKLIQKK